MNRTTLMLFFCGWCLSAESRAAGLGNPSVTPLHDSATICLQVGATAELTGLNDFTLTPSGVSGAAGTEYQGSDQFHLSSNTAVRLIIEATPLSQEDQVIRSSIKVDGLSRFLDTASDAAHDDDHELQVTAVLGAISSQLAGSYQSTITLTVVPLIGGETGCGSSTLTLAGGANTAVIAFEDLYPSAGDADYNDFVVRYSVEEHYNTDGELEKIDMNYTPVARGAGYNHTLKLDLNGVISRTSNAFAETEVPFIGDAMVKLTYTNLENGNERTKVYSSDDDIVIFSNTRSSLAGFANVYDGASFTAPRTKTQVEIFLDQPELNLLTDSHEVAADKYRVYLDVLSTNKDIDLAIVNPDDGMIDQNGYPFGILVPENWAWMLERQHIEEAYPHFEEYRRFLNGETEVLTPEAANWYDAIDTSSTSTIDIGAFDSFLAEQLNL